MKRFVSILLVALMISAMAIAAFAAEGSVYAVKDEWKSCIGYTKRAASGSFWKGTYKSGPASASEAYLYMQGGDRCTKILSFSKTTAYTGLNYLSGQAITGKYYKLNCRGGAEGTYAYYFNP